MSLTPSTGRLSPFGVQTWPPSVLSQTPPLPAPTKIRFAFAGETATAFSRPRLGSRIVLLPTSVIPVGPSWTQLETAVGAVGASGNAGASGGCTENGAAPKP